MTNLPISVIIPCHNVAGMITRQLDAVADQLPAGSEVIVVDDASDDRTPDVVDRWSANRQGLDVTVIRRDRRGGPNASRNDGFLRSSGAILLFCDGDDIVGPGWVDALSDAVVDGAIAGGVYVPFSDDRLIADGSTTTSEWSGDTAAHGWPYALGGCLGVSRLTLRAIGGFDEAIRSGGTEVELAIRAQVAEQATVVAAPTAVVHYRIPPPANARAWYAREFRKERGRSYLRAKFGSDIIRDRTSRHLLSLCASLPGEFLRACRDRRDTWRLGRLLGKITGWMVWTPIAQLGVRLDRPSFRESLAADR